MVYCRTSINTPYITVDAIIIKSVVLEIAFLVFFFKYAQIRVIAKIKYTPKCAILSKKLNPTLGILEGDIKDAKAIIIAQITGTKK